MPTSDAHKHSWTRGALFLLVLALCAALANVALTVLLVPYGSKSQIAWTDYAAQEQVDCVVVGTSTAMSGLDPKVLDQRLGMQTFNLATPSQMLEESYLAIKTAYEDHGISHAILSLGHGQLTETQTPNPGSAFMHQRSQVVSLRQHLDGVAYLLFEGGAITQPQSLNMAFPWVSNKVSSSLGAVLDNARMKLDGTSLYEAAQANEPGWTYEGKGFGYYTHVLNYNGTNVTSVVEGEQDADEQDAGAVTPAAQVMDQARMRALDRLCSYCRDHGIQLVVVTPPLPAFSIVEQGEAYFALGEQIKAFVTARGGRYFDVNLAQPQLYTYDEGYFTDSMHLNWWGAQAFSEATATLVQAVDAGQDTSGLFRTGQEYLQSVTSISCVFLDGSVQADGIHLKARAMVGPDVAVEYRFSVYDGNDPLVAREWSAEDEWTWVPPAGEHGEVWLRADARVVGSTADYDRYRDLLVMY